MSSLANVGHAARESNRLLKLKRLMVCSEGKAAGNTPGLAINNSFPSIASSSTANSRIIYIFQKYLNEISFKFV